MAYQKNKGKTFEGLKYRTVQRKNSRDRNLLTLENQQYLKKHGYRNLGWNNVISLFKKIQELQNQESINNLSLEELFLEADRIGNQYLNNQEVQEINSKIAQELNEIFEIVESQFPDNQTEMIDYSKV